MICANCKSKSNEFPQGIWRDFPGWCMKCIHEEIEYRYKVYRDKHLLNKGL